MYTTIEADIENGRVKSSEIQKLPPVAHVLITLLSRSSETRPNWDFIKARLGKLKLREDSVAWQRKIRSEWD